MEEVNFKCYECGNALHVPFCPEQGEYHVYHMCSDCETSYQVYFNGTSLDIDKVPI